MRSNDFFRTVIKSKHAIIISRIAFSFATVSLGVCLIYVNLIITQHCCKREERQKTSFHFLGIDVQEDMSIRDDTDLHRRTGITDDIDLQ